MKLYLAGFFATILFSLSSLTASAQRPLGTFTIGAATTTNCPQNSVCRNFNVSIPNYPYNPVSGWISVKTPHPPIVAVDVFLSGSGGWAWWGRNPETPLTSNFFESLLAQHHQIVQITWIKPWFYSTQGFQLGQIAAACRVATVLNWIHTNYPAPEFNVIGSSAGGAALAYCLANYGSEAIIDKAIMSGSPPFMALARGCNNVTGYAYPPYAKGYIDSAYAYNNEQTQPGPCWLSNSQFNAVWNLNSVESGLDYYYPNTHLHIFIGTEEDRFISNRAIDYYSLLVRSHQPFLTYHLVDGMGHLIMQNQHGLNQLFGALR